MHKAVLTDKILEYLDPKPNQNFVDCTAGAGGHTTAILERTAPKGKVLAIDWDQEAIKQLKIQNPKSKIQNRLVLREGNFADVKNIVREEKFQPITGIVFDLGFSSDQLGRGRGLSFQKDEPLDMRYSKTNPVTAEKIVNFSSKAELERILKEYGEEEFANQIATAIVEHRAQKPITKTGQLVKIIEQATPKSYQRKKIAAATKTFQALRIAANNELENVRAGLKGAAEVLPAGGTIAVVSFHSLEDRVVKNFFKQEHSLQPITKKPIVPSQTEIQHNPRSRSAKLRVAKKL
ncbi:MAG TPA: 16S rRNA (cytosine(1402)-N(4))-methyltransferase RsmH [Candidatus Paceibacterota bacterium]